MARACAIVCGYPANADGSISSILKSRMDKAIELYKTHEIDYIIVSGGAIHNRYKEAEVMRDYALKQGISKERILVENKAKSTYHNMMYSQALMNEYHLSSCYIVTNSYHMVKARYYARKFNLDFKAVKCAKPADMSYLKVFLLTLYYPLNMIVNRLRGYK